MKRERLHPRAITKSLTARITSRPVTVLTGARQTGKTTLVRDILRLPNFSEPIYYSLDDPDERLRLAADPVRRIDHGDRLVILDEVQKLPVLIDAVKLLVDRHVGHRFLLLGSSHIILLNKVRESLAGRAALLELWPLSLIEMVEGKTVPSSGMDVIRLRGEIALKKLVNNPPDAETHRLWANLAEEHIRWGGYPGLESLVEKEKSVWLRDFRKTYLERDLADLGRVSDLDQFALAQNLLAARSASLLSYSEVARELGVAVNTVKRYIRFLEISYQAFILRPLLPTVTGRLVKSPKFYWTDVGLARLLAERPDIGDGAMFETAVLNELIRWSSWQDEPPTLNFYRTAGGREVDFILHWPDLILAIEVKASRLAHRLQARPLVDFLSNTSIRGTKPDAGRIGLVVTRGRETRMLAPNIWEIPFFHLFGPKTNSQAIVHQVPKQSKVTEKAKEKES